jgi:hypothetical protein
MKWTLFMYYKLLFSILQHIHFQVLCCFTYLSDQQILAVDYILQYYLVNK